MKPDALTPATVPTRRAFSERMAEYGAIDGDFVVFEADIGYSTFSHLFGDRYPERYFNMGIAEQDLMGTAAGLALGGKIPFASTFAMFATGRAWEQIRQTIKEHAEAAVRSIKATYEKYPKTGPILPAMGYGEAQTRDLEETINKSDVDMVVVGTPIDLTRVIKITKPYQRVRYELQEIGQPTLEDILMKKFGMKK